MRKLVIINGWRWWIDEQKQMMFENENDPIEKGTDFKHLTTQERNQMENCLRFGNG
jgi:hypothetical protein